MTRNDKVGYGNNEQTILYPYNADDIFLQVHQSTRNALTIEIEIESTTSNGYMFVNSMFYAALLQYILQYV